MHDDNDGNLPIRDHIEARGDIVCSQTFPSIILQYPCYKHYNRRKGFLQQGRT
jgi:hypothetical protein